MLTGDRRHGVDDHRYIATIIRIKAADGDSESLAGFSLEDDGDGVPRDERDEIFDHSYTTNTDGTGFVLSIVEAVVDAHGWSISICDSERFEVTDVEGGS